MSTLPESAFPSDDVPPKPVSSEQLAPWPLMDNKIQRKTIYKTLEEISELQKELATLSKTLARCLMQGTDDFDPTTGVYNRDALQKEIADVLANIKLLIKNLELDQDYIKARKASKYGFLEPLHART